MQTAVEMPWAKETKTFFLEFSVVVLNLQYLCLYNLQEWQIYINLSPLPPSQFCIQVFCANCHFILHSNKKKRKKQSVLEIINVFNCVGVL